MAAWGEGWVSTRFPLNYHISGKSTKLWNSLPTTVAEVQVSTGQLLSGATPSDGGSKKLPTMRLTRAKPICFHSMNNCQWRFDKCNLLGWNTPEQPSDGSCKVPTIPESNLTGIGTPAFNELSCYYRCKLTLWISNLSAGCKLTFSWLICSVKMLDRERVSFIVTASWGGTKKLTDSSKLLKINKLWQTRRLYWTFFFTESRKRLIE